MNSGKIKWYSAKLGYGFLLDDKNNELFFHYQVVKSNNKRIKKGLRIMFGLDHEGKVIEIRVTDEGPV